MKKDEQPVVDVDVTDENYQGTSRVVASAGYLYLSHMAATFGGMALAGLAAFMLHTKVNTGVGRLHEFAEKGGSIRQGLVKFFVGSRHGTHELHKVVEELDCVLPEQKTKLAELVKAEEMSFFQHKAVQFTDVLQKNKLGKRLIEGQPESRMEATFVGAGLGAISGWLGSTIWSIHKGTHEGNKGRHQHERAKEQINSLKEDNADLNKINDDLHEKYVKASTRLDTIQAAQDNAARDAAERSEAPLTKELAAAQTPAPTTPEPVSMTPAPATNVQLDEHQHHGKLAEKELAVA